MNFWLMKGGHGCDFFSRALRKQPVQHPHTSNPGRPYNMHF